MIYFLIIILFLFSNSVLAEKYEYVVEDGLSIQIGNGWDRVKSDIKYATCIKGAPSTSDDSKDLVFSKSNFSSVVDSNTLSKALSVNAQASFKAFFGGGSNIKLSSISRYKFDSQRAVYSYYIAYGSRPTYINVLAIDSLKSDHLPDQIESIRLNDGAKKLLGENPVEFTRRCGDSFVIATIAITELWGTIETQKVLNDKKESVRVDTSYSGSGTKLSVGVLEELAKNNSKESINIKFESVGYNGPAPSSVEELKALIGTSREHISSNAAKKVVYVVPYKELSNYAPLEVNYGVRSKIVALYMAMEDISKFIDEILHDTSEWVFKYGVTVDSLIELDTHLRTDIALVKDIGQKCFLSSGCVEGLHELRKIDILNAYRYLSQLPIHRSEYKPFKNTDLIDMEPMTIQELERVEGESYHNQRWSKWIQETAETGCKIDINFPTCISHQSRQNILNDMQHGL